eukprot:768810-Hanusia_phi.AAC.2
MTEEVASITEKMGRFRKMMVVFACIGLIGLVTFFYAHEDDGSDNNENAILASKGVFISDTVAKERAAIARRKGIIEIDHAEAVLKEKILAKKLKSLQKEISSQDNDRTGYPASKVRHVSEKRAASVASVAARASQGRDHTMALRKLAVKAGKDDDVTHASLHVKTKEEGEENALKSQDLRDELKHIEEQEDDDLQSLKHKIEDFGSTKHLRFQSQSSEGMRAQLKDQLKHPIFRSDQVQSLALKSSNAPHIQGMRQNNSTRGHYVEKHEREDGYLSDKTLNDVLKLAREDEEYFHADSSANRSSSMAHHQARLSVSSNTSVALVHEEDDVNSTRSSHAAEKLARQDGAVSISPSQGGNQQKSMGDMKTKNQSEVAALLGHNGVHGNVSAAVKKQNAAKFAIKEINPLRVIDQALLKETETSEQKAREDPKRSSVHKAVKVPTVREVKKPVVVHDDRSSEHKDLDVIDPLKIINKAYDEEKMEKESKIVKEERNDRHDGGAAVRFAENWTACLFSARLTGTQTSQEEGTSGCRRILPSSCRGPYKKGSSTPSLIASSDFPPGSIRARSTKSCQGCQGCQRASGRDESSRDHQRGAQEGIRVEGASRSSASTTTHPLLPPPAPLLPFLAPPSLPLPFFLSLFLLPSPHLPSPHHSFLPLLILSSIPPLPPLCPAPPPRALSSLTPPSVSSSY